MNFHKEFDTKISLLEEHEHNSISSLNESIDVGKRWNSYIENSDQKKIASLYLNADSNGDCNLFKQPTLGNWGNASDQLPVLSQLITNSNLIIDLKPFSSEKECFEKYGVTSKQLLELSINGYVSINLLAYDSERKVNFKNYKSFDNTILLDLLDTNISKCRINSIRRRAFFKRILSLDNKNIDFSYYLNQSRETIERALSDIPEAVFSSMQGSRSTNKNSIIETVVQHYAYCKCLIPVYQRNDLKIASEVNQILDQILEDFSTKERIEANLVKIRGLKTCLAGPITSSMGGIYNMSTGAYSSLYEAFSYSKEDTYFTKPIDRIVEEFLSYVMNLRIDARSAELSKRPLSDDEFYDFLKFVDELADKRHSLVSTLNNLQNLEGDLTYDRLLEGKTYFDIESEIEKNLKKIKSIPNALAIASIIGSGIPAAGLGLTEFNIIGVSLGLILYGGSRYFNPKNMLREEKLRIMLNLEDVRKIANKK